MGEGSILDLAIAPTSPYVNKVTPFWRAVRVHNFLSPSAKSLTQTSHTCSSVMCRLNTKFLLVFRIWIDCALFPSALPCLSKNTIDNVFSITPRNRTLARAFCRSQARVTSRTDSGPPLCGRAVLLRGCGKRAGQRITERDTELFPAEIPPLNYSLRTKMFIQLNFGFDWKIQQQPMHPWRLFRE